MISIQINCNENLRYIERKLADLKGNAPSVLVKAVNKTARDARKELAAKAKEEYTIKMGGFNKAMKIQNAKKSNPTATIKATGKPIALGKFNTRFSQGDAAKAKVLKKGRGFKSLVLHGAEKSGRDLKAFIAKFGSGHTAVVQRVPGKKMRSKNKEAIREFYSVSVPKMIGSEQHVYGIVKPNIQSKLRRNIDAEIEKVIARNRG